MGTLRGENGGDRPFDDRGLPGFPADWGPVFIPDDASALDAEGAPVRRRFRQHARRQRWRQRFRLAPRTAPRVDHDSPSLAVPLLIMFVSITATLLSLFAVSWNDPPEPSAAPPDAIHLPPPPAGAIAMLDAGGHAVRLDEVAPAVVLLLEGCTCETFVAATAAVLATPNPATALPVRTDPPAASDVSLIVVDATIRPLPQLTVKVPARSLADPNHYLRASVPALATSPRPAALLIGRDGTVVQAIPNIRSAEDVREGVVKLANPIVRTDPAAPRTG